MPGLPDIDTQAQAYIMNVCFQPGCVYAESIGAGKPKCLVKENNAVVSDFTANGCAAAAIPVEEGKVSEIDLVFPVTIKANGETELGELSVLKEKHRELLIRQGNKIVYQAEY